jgi:hypothetical protein
MKATRVDFFKRIVRVIYEIDIVRAAPTHFVTADGENRVIQPDNEVFVIPMSMCMHAPLTHVRNHRHACASVE